MKNKKFEGIEQVREEKVLFHFEEIDGYFGENFTLTFRRFFEEEHETPCWGEWFVEWDDLDLEKNQFLTEHYWDIICKTIKKLNKERK